MERSITLATTPGSTPVTFASARVAASGTIAKRSFSIPSMMFCATFSAGRGLIVPEIAFVSYGLYRFSSASCCVSVSGGNEQPTWMPYGNSSPRNDSRNPRTANFVGAYAV